MPRKRFFVFWILIMASYQFLMTTRYPSLAGSEIPIFVSYYGNLSGRVMSGVSGLPISDAEIKANGMAAKTDFQGRYVLSGLLPGKYTLTYSAAGYEPQHQENVVVERIVTTYVPDVILFHGMGSIKGKVLNAGSKTPMIGVKVSTGAAATYTDSNGDFYFSLVRPGNYNLSYHAPGNTQTQDNISALEGEVTTPPTVLMPIFPQVHYGSRDKKRIALTIDDGFRQDYPLVDFLKSQGVRATAFIVGQAIPRRTQFVRYLDSLGWEIANHTFSHSNMQKQSDAQIANELQSAQRWISSVTHKQSPFARPPYGTADPRIINAINAAGYTAAYWTLDLLDTRRGVPLSTQTAVVLNGAKNGDIIVCHFGGKNTLPALSVIVPELKKRGFEFVTMSELFE